ncbi:MAG: ABC transporter ATP-binding protein [Actinomycetota bacterium]|nr:ABC transporter ATP-binding protein [Actinomycetota bacterium]MDD5666706.1 ABC transporter ATP-binding protein [Actinomycetota bacterium]
MLELRDLAVAVDGRQILSGIDLEIGYGETHVLFGPNGSGKTTLLMALMGFPRYQVTGGAIKLNGEDITSLPPDERARRGIGMMYQRPPTVRGVSLRQMVSISSRDDLDVASLAGEMNLEEFLERDVNHGFSGGEIKRSELLQLQAQNPDLVLLDEPESGVDMENLQLVGRAIRRLLQKDLVRRRSKSGLIITHTGYILDYVEADHGHVLCNGTIVCSGNPREQLEGIRRYGFEECATCTR